MTDVSTKLTIIIPAYNEAQFIGQLLDQVEAVDLSVFNMEKEIIVIDDCSTDNTAEIVTSHENVMFLQQEKNQGKGSAVRRGIAAMTGDLAIIQDADLEYDPNDYVAMIKAIKQPDVNVVYGSRYMHGKGNNIVSRWVDAKNDNQSWEAYLGGRSLSFMGYIFAGQYLTDTVTALKLFERDVIKSMVLVTSGFELDHEITSKVLAGGNLIKEVPISYFPRSKEEGKKIGFSDWITGMKTFIRFGKRS